MPKQDPNAQAMINDLKFAIRQLLKNPGFTLVATLTLMLGIAACTTTFSLVNAVLLRPLAFQEPERLVWMQNAGNETLSSQAMLVDHLIDWREQATSFQEIAAFNPFSGLGGYTLSEQGLPRRLRGMAVSQNFLPVLGLQPLIGRHFTEEECSPSGPKAVMLSHALWQEHFSADTSVVGTTAVINDKPRTIAGILPPNTPLDRLLTPGERLDALFPQTLEGDIRGWGNTVIGVGRLKENVSLERAKEEMAVLNAALLEKFPERAGYSNGRGPVLKRLDDHVRGGFRRAFGILAVAVLLVWLIACVNLANLLLARAEARSQEISMRTALGASRGRLLRQSLTESLLLAFVGCVLGTALALLGIDLLSKVRAFDVPLLKTATLDLRAVAIAVMTALLSAVFCGLWPAVQLWKRNPATVLQDSGSRGNSRRDGAWFRRSLVVSEMAFACILLVGAGLLMRSFIKTLEVDLGFAKQDVFSWHVETQRDFETAEARIAYYEGLTQSVAAVPGVEVSGLSDTVPFGFRRDWPLRAKGAPEVEGGEYSPYVRFVDHQALQIMKTPLITGRYFSAHDRIGSERVMMVSQSVAHRLWPGEDAVGKVALSDRGREYRVVGVVADVAHALDGETEADFYHNFNQWDRMDHYKRPNLLVRTSGSAEAIIPKVRAAIHEYDPSIASNEFTAISQVVDQAIAPRRLITTILAVFSALALLLASVGLYGVIAYSVGRRTREIGIRFAIGARRLQVSWMVIKDVFRVAGAGVIIGLLGAVFIARFLESQLFGIGAADPVTYLAALVILGAVALLAAWLPARRAAMIEPVEALRAE